MSLRLYNTLGRKLEDFKPLHGDRVGLYTCGPTVYSTAHIGNLRTYIFEDVLRRTLELNEYTVSHAMNITDVGHLVGDEDFAEDKIDLAAQAENKNPLDIAQAYEAQFFQDLKKLNIKKANTVMRATDAIPEQIEIIQTLLDKGFAYQDKYAVYFDTSKLSDYGKLSGQKLSEKKVGSRKDVIIDSQKKNPQDFALWFFLEGRYKHHILHWPAPWGVGFPGWHVECSAISRKILGQPFDIHTGGVDHIGTHHTNEIAQSEAAFGTPLANFWLHSEFLILPDKRMGKSEGNSILLQNIIDRGINPLAFRYLCLQTHYRKPLSFTWESLEAAAQGLNNIWQTIDASAVNGKIGCAEFEERFLTALHDDLNTSQTLAIMHELLKSEYPWSAKLQSLSVFDKMLGLNLLGRRARPWVTPTPAQQKILDQRRLARDSKDWSTADDLRDELLATGFEVVDDKGGQRLRKK